MKKIFIALLTVFSISLFAQEEEMDMSKYLAGALTLQDGKVVFEREFDAPSLTKEQVYEVAHTWLEEMLYDESVKNQMIFEDKDSDIWWVASMPEHFLVFRKTLLSVDRTFIKYRIRVEAMEEKARIKLWDIRYEYYTNERKPELYTAETAIVDEIALDKTGTKLNRMTSKFRIKTIDMFDEFCKDFSRLIETEVTKTVAAMNRGEEKAQRNIISYERGATTVVPDATAAPAKKEEAPVPAPAPQKQPTMAELQAQMAKKKSAAPVVAPVPVPVKKAETPAPAPAAPVASTPAAPIDVPADIFKMISTEGMVISADGKVAVAMRGGISYVNGKAMLLCYVKENQMAHTILSATEKYSVSVGNVTIECKKVSSDKVQDMILFTGEILKINRN